MNSRSSVLHMSRSDLRVFDTSSQRAKRAPGSLSESPRRLSAALGAPPTNLAAALN